jgi:bifunctional DNase/RNase/ribosome-associated translation inhibitor RaiA
MRIEFRSKNLADAAELEKYAESRLTKDLSAIAGSCRGVHVLLAVEPGGEPGELNRAELTADLAGGIIRVAGSADQMRSAIDLAIQKLKERAVELAARPRTDGAPVEVIIDRVGVEPESGRTVVLLRADGGRILPIWIGPAEAVSIMSAMAGNRPERPQTHDLLLQAIQTLGASVVRVEVHGLVNGVFLGRLVLRKDTEETVLDTRPSDGIAIAVRAGAPVLVAEDVLVEAALTVQEAEAGISSDGRTLN